VSVVSDAAGSLLASSSVARTPTQAAVRLWRASDGRPAGVLPGHDSTAIGLAFSPCGRVLATVSRDRHLCLYRSQPAGADTPPGAGAAASSPGEDGGGGGGGGGWALLARVKAHKRMAWCAHFEPGPAGPGGLRLATGGREGAVRLWRLEGDVGAGDVASLRLVAEGHALEKAGAAVTALAFAPAGPGRNRLAVGLDDGRVLLLEGGRAGDGSAAAWAEVPGAGGLPRHTGSVRGLAWARDAAELGGDVLLASCGDDGAVTVSRASASDVMGRAE